MRNKVAKAIRHYAEKQTIGKPKDQTEKLTEVIKKAYSSKKRAIFAPKIKLSDRQMRIEKKKKEDKKLTDVLDKEIKKKCAPYKQADDKWNEVIKNSYFKDYVECPPNV